VKQLEQEHDYEAVRSALHGPRGKELMKFMSDSSQGLLATDCEPNARELASCLGWIDDAGQFTTVGRKVADSFREYLLWEERGRVVHQWTELPALQPELFDGKRVLEIGCGFGCNLLSLQQHADEVLGVEIEPVYVALSPILAELAGLPAPTIHVGSATEIPVPSNSVDRIVCFGALQYMPIVEALHESARLLRPGGLAVFVHSHLSGYVSYTLRTLGPLLRTPKAALREAVTFAGMLAYPFVGRRVTREGDPVYPTQARMRRWIEAAGMRLDPHRTRTLDHETCYVAVMEPN
jgi:SAM-dependent methyltransferase